MTQPYKHVRIPRSRLPFMWVGWAMWTGKPPKMKRGTPAVSKRRPLWSTLRHCLKRLVTVPSLASRFDTHPSSPTFRAKLVLLAFPCESQAHKQPMNHTTSFCVSGTFATSKHFPRPVPSHSYSERARHCCHHFADGSSVPPRRCRDVPQVRNVEKSDSPLEQTQLLWCHSPARKLLVIPWALVRILPIVQSS